MSQHSGGWQAGDSGRFRQPATGVSTWAGAKISGMPGVPGSQPAQQFRQIPAILRLVFRFAHKRYFFLGLVWQNIRGLMISRCISAGHTDEPGPKKAPVQHRLTGFGPFPCRFAGGFPGLFRSSGIGRIKAKGRQQKLSMTGPGRHHHDHFADRSVEQ